MKVLHLTLKRKWFDMIASGEKKEEYRDLSGFWIKRLGYWSESGPNGYYDYGFTDFDAVLFANGGHFGNVPKLLVKCEDIDIKTGKPEWGAEPGKKYFVIKLGERIDL